MADVLKQILAVKAGEIVRAKGVKALATVRDEARRAVPARDFVGSLR